MFLSFNIRQWFLAIALSLFCVGAVHAYDFTLNEAEFESWSDRCKGLYLSTIVGRRSDFINRMSLEEITRWRDETKVTKGGPWHYCAGLIWFKRAKQEPDPELRRFKYEQALKQYQFTIGSFVKRYPWYAEMLVNTALVYKELGELQKAMDKIVEVKQLHPTYYNAYLLESIVLREAGELDKAIASLHSAPDEFQKRSPQLHYYLGLMYLEEGNVELASHHADIAYDMGYPLPGLKLKLAEHKQTQVNE